MSANTALVPAFSSTAVRIGEVLTQRYRIERLLGEGAMGSVFAAEDLESGQRVAVKVLKSTHSVGRIGIERFRREIEATRRLDCEYIVRTMGVGYLDDQLPFMVMEYHEATDLSKLIAESGALPIDRAIEFGLQICLALAHAHRVGIIHRDIKPANVLVVRETNRPESIKVLDFGVSKITSEGPITVRSKLTASAVRLGSPLYMSPEQRTSAREVDERTDIWSLGITLFEMLTGVVPFDSSPKSLRAMFEGPSSVPSLSRHRPSVPRELDRVIARCLQRAPSARFQNVAELASALAWFARPEIARLSGEVGRVLGAPRFSSKQRPPAAVEGAFVTSHLGATTTLGPAITEGPATVRVTPTRRGLFVRVSIAAATLIVAAASTVVTFNITQTSPAIEIRRFPAMPSATWAQRVRSLDRWLVRPGEFSTTVTTASVPPYLAPSRVGMRGTAAPNDREDSGSDSVQPERLQAAETSAAPGVDTRSPTTRPDMGY